MNNKWALGISLILLLVAFMITWHFAPAIQKWLADVFVDIIVLVLVFCAGWLMGRFGGKRRSHVEKNAKNITKAQK